MEALQYIGIIVVSVIGGSIALGIFTLIERGFLRLRHRARDTRMPKRIRRINTVC